MRPLHLHYSPPAGVRVEPGVVIEIPNERRGWEPYRVTVVTTRPASGSAAPAAWAWGLDQSGRGRLVKVGVPPW